MNKLEKYEKNSIESVSAKFLAVQNKLTGRYLHAADLPVERVSAQLHHAGELQSQAQDVENLPVRVNPVQLAL